MGDLNLYHRKRFDVNYDRKGYFEKFGEKLGKLNLVQLINFDTWSRVVGQILRSSILDHVYVQDIIIVNNISHVKPCFGDHELIVVQLCITRPKLQTTIKRDWRQYSKEKLNLKLGRVDWTNNATDVQEIWNDFECKLMKLLIHWCHCQSQKEISLLINLPQT